MNYPTLERCPACDSPSLLYFARQVGTIDVECTVCKWAARVSRKIRLDTQSWPALDD